MIDLNFISDSNALTENILVYKVLGLEWEDPSLLNTILI